MQTNKQQTASFPFLGYDRSDYKKTSFGIKINKGFKDKEVCFEVIYDLDNEELIKLIEEQKLYVVASLFCQPVGLNLSNIIPPDAKNTKFFVHKIDIEKSVEFQAHLIAAEDIVFTNSDFSKEWAGESYFVEQYNEIGCSEKVALPLEHVKDGKKKSIFQFQEKKDLDDNAPATCNLEGDVIQFIVPHSLYLSYNKVKNKKDEAILASFIIPAISDILRRMIESEEDEEENEFNSSYSGKRWYRVVTDKYESIIKKDPKSGEVDPFKAAQMLVYNPINGLLTFIKNWVNRSEEED